MHLTRQPIFLTAYLHLSAKSVTVFGQGRRDEEYRQFRNRLLIQSPLPD